MSELIGSAASIDEIGRIAHENSKAHGFWDGLSLADPMVIPAKLALVHEEVSEALGEFRSGRMHLWFSGPELKKPEGFGVELGDAVIRIGDLYEKWRRSVLDAQSLTGRVEIPTLGELIALKHAYNVERPHMHGRNC